MLARVFACVLARAWVRLCLRAMHEYLPQSTVGAEFPIPYNFHYQYNYESINLKTFNLFYYEGWNFNSGNYFFLQLIQNRYMFRSFTVLQCSHQHCVQPVASDVGVVYTFSSACCVDSSNGAVYRLKNL